MGEKLWPPSRLRDTAKPPTRIRFGSVGDTQMALAYQLPSPLEPAWPQERPPSADFQISPFWLAYAMLPSEGAKASSIRASQSSWPARLPATVQLTPPSCENRISCNLRGPSSVARTS